MMRLFVFVSLACASSLAFSPASVPKTRSASASTSLRNNAMAPLFSSTAMNPHDYQVMECPTKSLSFFPAAFSQRSAMSLSSMAVVERVQDTMGGTQTVTPPPQQQDNVQEETRSGLRKLYVQFAQRYPFVNNLLIATFKSGAADFMAQTVIGGATLQSLDVSRSVLFMLFGALYSGGFQYLYQVRIFQKLFDVTAFTQQSWRQKLRDRAGLQSLAMQTALDLAVLTAVYLPTFYIFKASVFSSSIQPWDWMRAGVQQYRGNIIKDAMDVLMVWLPADLICFSVPMYLRLPVRHSVSFLWTVYLSFARGGH